MDKKHWVTGAVLGVFLCGTGVAIGQLHRSAGPGMGGQKQRPTGRTAGMTIAPLTPAQKANEDKKYRLERAAATALDAGRYEEAETDARQSMSLGADSGLAQELLASALNAQGRTQEALDMYQQMANAGGDEPRNLLPYALLLLKAGHWAQAVVAYNKQLPSLADGDLMAAYNHFSPTVSQPRELETAIHIALGLTYNSEATLARHSQADKAQSEYNHALALAPNSALANYYYGRSLQRLGRRAEAQTAFQKAVRFGKGAVQVEAKKAMR